MEVLNKKEFYSQIKKYCNPFLKQKIESNEILDQCLNDFYGIKDEENKND